MARLKKLKFNNTSYEFPVEDVKVGTTSVVTDGVATIDLSGKADDNAVVKLTGNQTIAWTKTFSTSPVVPSKTTNATNTWTAIATEAQVYKKQDKLATQTAYTSKGSATKVPQITTNTLWQVTGITEVTITQPTVNNWTLTIKQWGTSKGTFTANQSSASTVDLNTCFLKTQVEYDALPASKATDGNFYFIYSS